MPVPKKLPSGKWRAQGYHKDPVTGAIYRPSFVADSKAEAAMMVANWQVEKRITGINEMTVRTCIDLYIKSKEAVLSPSTIRGYKVLQRNHYSEIAEMPIRTLTDSIMQRVVAGISINHSPKYVRNAYALLSSSVFMFSGKRYRVTLPKKEEIERSIPTDDQVKELLNHAKPPLNIAIALAAVGTLRAGEVCALRFRDVDRSTNMIHVHSDMVKTYDNKWVVKAIPKTNSSDRYIPMPKEMIDLIGDGDPDDFVYGKSPSALTQAFAKLRNSLGMRCRFHDLRHYAVSIMHAIGIPDVYIMERGGFSSDAVLKSVYRNSLSDQSAIFAAKANDHFSGLLS